MPELSLWNWVLVYFAAFLIGVAKTGLPGVGVITVAIFALTLPPKEAVGSVLLLLIGADCVAVATYRRDAEWKYIAKLFPSAAVGVIIGTVVFKWLAEMPSASTSIRRLIGGILLAMVAFQLVQRVRKPSDSGKKPALLDSSLQSGEKKAEDTEQPPKATVLPAIGSFVVGTLAGFTTMVANAAGPIMVLYFLTMRLPKIAFVGTTAWFFFCVNLFKVPFGIYLGMVTGDGLLFALMLFPGAALGGVVGRYLLKRVNQQWFEWLAILFTIIAGFQLLR